MDASGRGYFALYGYSENLKNLLLRKCLANFQIICRNTPWETLYQIPLSHVDWSKNMAARGRGYFALYDYSENLKNPQMNNINF